MKAADLRKSILQYAVEGKLVQQDIHDEPASLLYDKIIKEKESLIKQGKIKKEKPLPPITDNEIPYDIPNNWKWVRLGEVCDLSIGKTPERKIDEYWKDGIYNWVAISDMVNGGFINQTKEKISQIACNKVFKKNVLPIGTLLFSFKLTIGKVSLLNIPAYTNEAICAITPYLYDNIKYYLLKILPILNLLDNANDAIKGKTLNLQTLPLILVPLPPLKEQERIVKKVDELMALCDKLEQEEEKLSALDKHFADTLPKSILQYAVEGKLVPQNIHDEPASILYDKIIKEKENLIKQGKIKKEKPLPPITDDKIPYNVPENWKWVRLGEVFIIERGASPRPISSFVTNDINGINWIKIGDAKKGCKYITSTKEKITQEGAKRSRFVNIGDFIFSNSMSFGRPYILKINGCIHDGWNVLKQITNQIDSIKINSDFIYYIISSSLLQSQIIQKAMGGIVENIKSDNLKTLLFPLPPLKEQERIVKKVDELLTYCNKLKDII